MTDGNKPPVALTVAGSDSGGGAGIQADLKTFAAHGVYGTSALTAVTAQNTEGVSGVETMSPDFVALQITAVVEDIGADAAKTGMLATAAVISVVAEKLDEHHIEKVVVDPVMVATSGDRLLEDSAVETLKKELVPRAYIVTPNLPEAEALVGFPVNDVDSIKGAARQIVEMGAKAVVIKGGHAGGEESIDWLYDGRRFSRFAAPRVTSRNTHGTGCTFSAAIAAQLARGAQLEAAVRAAKRYVSAALETGLAVGRGHGPVDHFVGETIWPRRP